MNTNPAAACPVNNASSTSHPHSQIWYSVRTSPARQDSLLWRESGELYYHAPPGLQEVEARSSEPEAAVEWHKSENFEHSPSSISSRLSIKIRWWIAQGVELHGRLPPAELFQLH